MVMEFKIVTGTQLGVLGLSSCITISWIKTGLPQTGRQDLSIDFIETTAVLSSPSF